MYALRFRAVLCAAAAAICLRGIDAGQPQPCACEGPLLDCSSRGKFSLYDDDRCDTEITRVDLSFNQLSTFPEGLSESVVELNLTNNKLKSLPRPPLLNPRTTVLDVSRNGIANITDELSTLSSLQVLIMSKNEISSLALPSPCQLRRLDVSRNLINNLGNLRKCEKLEWLDVGGNSLLLIPGDAFLGLYKLQHLSLKCLSLQRIPTGLFTALSDLEELDLSENQLTDLPYKEFVYLSHLLVLSLQKNSFTSISTDFLMRFPSLEYLDMSECPLKALSSLQFERVPRLKTLRLADCGFTELPADTFAELNELTKLDLSNNQISSFPAGLFVPLNNIESLHMRECGLTSVPWNELRRMTNMRELELSMNDLTSLPHDAFADLKSLEQLHMQENQLTTVPEFNANTLPNLTYAGFGDNITKVSERIFRSWLAPAKAPRELDLCYTGLELTSLCWALEDNEIDVSVATGNPSCGYIVHGNGSICFCIDTRGGEEQYCSGIEAKDCVLIKVARRVCNGENQRQ